MKRSFLQINAFLVIMFLLHPISIVQARQINNVPPQIEFSNTIPPKQAYVYLPSVLNGKPCSDGPTLLYPTNGSTLDTLIPLLSWYVGNDGQGTYIRTKAEFARDANFLDYIGCIASDQDLGVFETRRGWVNFDPSTTVFWRAYQICGDVQSSYSETWSFTTGSTGTILPAPTLLAPQNGSAPSSLPITFKWSPVAGALEYAVQYTIPGSRHIYGGFASGTLYEAYIGLLPSTTYEWWVSARNDYAWGEESIRWQFTTPAATFDKPTETMTPLLIVDLNKEFLITTK